jgi:hypothetical protein
MYDVLVYQPDIGELRINARSKGEQDLYRAQFGEYLNEVVQTEPTDTIDAMTLGFWASVGIQKGKPFTPHARMKKTLTEAAQVGDASTRALCYRFLIKEA